MKSICDLCAYDPSAVQYYAVFLYPADNPTAHKFNGQGLIYYKLVEVTRRDRLFKDLVEELEMLVLSATAARPVLQATFAVAGDLSRVHRASVLARAVPAAVTAQAGLRAAVQPVVSLITRFPL